ncbi:MAG: FAD-binding oxidoreductase [Gammaproteobacteria bacterium]
MKPQENADSYYRASCRYAVEAQPLCGARRADVAVIGGGITGISAALHLAERGAEVALLEARDFGWGASGRSGGQILAGYSIDQRALERLAGAARARELWEHSLAALEWTRRRIAEAQIDCDLAANYLHVAVRKSQARDLRNWAEHLRARYAYDALEYLEREPLRGILGSELYAGAVADRGSGHLHPLNYCLGLACAAQRAGAKLYRDSAVREVRAAPASAVTLRTDAGELRCEQVIYAGNAYLGNLQPRLAKMIMPVGTYIIATEPLAPAVAEALIANRAAVADTNLVLDYYRLSADHRMLFGGRVSYSGRAPRNLARPLRRRMLRVFPQLAGAGIDFAWGGKVAITRNRAPHIGRLDARGWFAHGFSGQGMALSGYAGGLLADAVMGETARLECFRAIPHRAFPGGVALRAPMLVAEMAWRRLADRFA